MRVTELSTPQYRDITEIAYAMYHQEVKRHLFLTARSRADFDRFFAEQSADFELITLQRHGRCVGYLLYQLTDRDGKRYCYVPAWGCGATGEQQTDHIDRLFQQLAKTVVSAGTTFFSVELYAGEKKLHRLFSFLQFATRSEKDIRCMRPISCTNQYPVRRLEPAELALRWDEIWAVLTQLIAHLQQSPVFYAGSEFTEALYRGFFEDAGTRVYIAEHAGTIIGLIEANAEPYTLAFADRAANVGEAFVLPPYRGKGAAQALLRGLERDLCADGIRQDWVEHGTANPTARGFWGKYFEPFVYEMIREITV